MNKQYLLVCVVLSINICFNQKEYVSASATQGGCPKNEYLKQCGRICERTCENPNPTVCPKLACVKDPSCSCEPGFLRNQCGCCIPPEQCQNVCPINEELKLGGKACEATCDDPDRKYCPLVDPSNDYQCTCKIGYVRDANGNCVEKSQCPIICPPNEYLKQCGRVCEPTCSNPSPEICPLYCTVEPQCSCESGYVRNEFGYCILPEQCNHCQCGFNETYTTCGSSCPKTCNPRYDAQIMCPAVCIEGCFCSNGYVSSTKYGCILPEDCPNEEKCFSNEEYKYCGTACPRTCKNLGALIKCTAQCVPGCFCKDGYVKSEHGCVKPDQCPLEELCTRPHDIYVENGTLCQRTCKNFWNYTCSTNNFGPVCLCEQNYVRNDDGFCVLPQECPNICGKNEYYDCGSACDTECGKIGEPCTIVNIKCNDKCYCIKGYARNKQWKCIPTASCPSDS